MNWRKNIYEENKSIGATSNPLIKNPDAIDNEFANTINKIISNAVELVRQLIPSHQSAIAIVVEKDWKTVRKYFSLSEKYAEWKHYAASATGYGIHGYMLNHNKLIRFTQEALESHPEWKNFGNEKGEHPPMRGWMAAPITDSKGKNWGLMQLSDKLEDDYSEDDEKVMADFVRLVCEAIELAWDKRNLLKEKQK